MNAENCDIKVSAIVPVHNAEKYLDKCINSIINQSLKDIEIILINDGSSDNSNQICEKYKEKDARISLYQSKGKGVSIARNIGISKAKGKWISFIDSDDWLEENMLEELYNVSQKRESDIIMCDAFINSYNKETVNEFYYTEKIFKEEEKEEIQIQAIVNIKGQYIPQTMQCGVPWAKLYNRQFIINNKLKFKENLPRRQDMIFNIEAFELANEINYIQKKLYHYNLENSNSIVRKYAPNICYEYNNIISELEVFLKKYKKEGSKWEEVYRNIIIEYYNAFLVFFFHEQNRKKMDEILGLFEQYLCNEKFDKILKKIKLNYKNKIILFLLNHKCKILLKLIQTMCIKYYDYIKYTSFFIKV